MRLDRFDRLLDGVRQGFGAAGSRLPVTGCYWGDLGRSERYTGASIPGFLEGRRGLGEGWPTRNGSADGEAGLLMLLLEDPLAELARLRDHEEFSLEPAGFRPIPDDVQRRNRTLQAAIGSVTTRVAEAAGTFAGPSTPVRADQVAGVVNDSFEEAARADRSLSEAALRDPLARAVTAGLYRVAVGEGDDLASEFRWSEAATVVEAVLAQQLGGERGLVGDLTADAFSLALRHGLRNRIMKGMSLFVGDVLAWFQNREAILDRLDAAVRRAAANGALVVVGHSLGGVIAFEYFVQTDRDVELLATVGSQVGLFAELGVLTTGDSAPDGRYATPGCVGAWRNLWDPDDALSFLATPVFTRVSDIEVDTRAPFPASHGEYWHLAETYAKLTAGAHDG